MRKRPLCFLCLTVLIILAVGGRFQSGLRPTAFETYVQDRQQITVQGQVYKIEPRENTWAIYTRNNSVLLNNKTFQTSNLIIYDPSFRQIQIGNTIQASGSASVFGLPRNPGNFNQRYFYIKQNIHGVMFANQVTIVNHDVDRLSVELARIRTSWQDLFFQAGGERTGAFLSAIVLGQRRELDGEIRERYRRTGIGHILAISGLHLSFLGLGLYGLLRKIGCSYGQAGVLAIALLLLYVLMVGFSVSVFRAFIMLIIKIGANITGCVYDLATALVLAMFIILFWKPIYIYDAGFLLSHGAVAGILLVQPFLRTIGNTCLPERISSKLQSLYFSAGIDLMLKPVILYFFFEIPLYSLLLNLIVVPLLSLIMTLAMAGSALFLVIPFIGSLLIQGSGVIIAFYDVLSEWFLNLPFSRIVIGRPQMWQIILFYICLFSGILLVKCKKNPIDNSTKTPTKDSGKTSIKDSEKGSIRSSLVALFVVGIGVGILIWTPNRTGEIQITMIDVGQGDSMFMRGPTGTTYLFDGGSLDVRQVGRQRIEPFLLSQGIGELDYVFISHGHSDHINAIEEMILRQQVGVRIGMLVFPVIEVHDEALTNLANIAREAGIRVVDMDAGAILTEGSLQIECIHPSRDFSGAIGNPSSKVLQVTFYNFDMLVTGDIEAEGEVMLTEKLERREFTVLSVSHHGSRNSTKEDFLDVVTPRYAFISAGVRSRFGHPHPDTLGRLKTVGSIIYNTAEVGAVTIRTNGKEMQISQKLKTYN